MKSLIIAGVTIFVLFGLGWFIDQNGYKRCQLEHSQANQAEYVRQAKKIQEAAKQHENDTATIDNLARELNKRMRVKITCPTPPQGDQDGGSRAFSEKVDGAFGRLQSGVDELVLRCDQLNVDAIEANKVR